MSGCIDWHYDIIDCPHCGNKQKVLFCEDYDLRTGCDIGIASGHHECTKCKKIIVDEDLQ